MRSVIDNLLKIGRTLRHQATIVLVGLGLLLIGLAGCSVQNSSRTIRVTATPSATSILKSAGSEIAALATRPGGEVLARITRAPDNAYLETLTPIPTITDQPTVFLTSTPTLPPTATLPPTETSTPTSSPTAGPTSTPTATPTSPLPDLPELLIPPTISQTIRVPILMYHYVSTPPEDADKYRINLSVEPETFRAQMSWLKERGYRSTDLYEIIEILATGGEPPEKVVVITFDDGYLDNYEYAYPILEEFGYKGTFFIPTEFIDFGYDGYMTWDMIEEMAAKGHRFESHTKSHPDLAILERNDHVWQILGSQETLAAHIGYKPRFFAYPSGSYSDLTLEMVESLNIWAAVTTQGGLWRGFHDRYEWKRTRVSYGTTLKDFERVFID
ncbi:MAG: polysaccharide deacetylase family protein [Anaerolineae bacterium]